MRNMTKGNIPCHLISYAVPLILGNVFQLTYNAVDSIILGRFSGKTALAAVGVASPIMNILIFFIVGICMGASVLMSEFFGAGDYKKLKQEISTTMAGGFIFTVAASILCAVLIKPLLLLVRTPRELIPDTSKYLQIVFLGLIFTFFYNIYASALRSTGDSKVPVICVSVSAVLNGILDFILVAVNGLGVTGAAIATVAAQAFSCLLCAGYVYKTQPLIRIKRTEFTVDKTLLKTTIHYSWATAMQQTCLYIGKVMVQGAVNPLGVDAIATFNAVTRIDDFAFSPEQSISHGMTTFIAQNRGAEKPERIRKGFSCGMLLETAYWLILCAAVLFGAEAIMKLFVPEDENVCFLGTAYLRFMSAAYLLPAWTNGIQGYFRGMGRMKVTLCSTAIQMAGRVSFAWLLAPRFGIQGIAWSCVAGWFIMLVYEFPLWIHSWKGDKIYKSR
ncbi:MAG: MATE family efflux transporter [Bacteroides sp.]|nr:MATE family efflux transporter [Prevotella sp.]MCM1407192.1 MATE family efflux transporter [Treponema brennaborense]MCM1470344.1 MATE family efflux transporter [Bacteroides sp.]